MSHSPHKNILRYLFDALTATITFLATTQQLLPSCSPFLTSVYYSSFLQIFQKINPTQLLLYALFMHILTHHIQLKLMRPFLTTNKLEWISQETEGRKGKGVIFVLYKKSSMWLHDMRGKSMQKDSKFSCKPLPLFGGSITLKFELISQAIFACFDVRLKSPDSMLLVWKNGSFNVLLTRI